MCVRDPERCSACSCALWQAWAQHLGALGLCLLARGANPSSRHQEGTQDVILPTVLSSGRRGPESSSTALWCKSACSLNPQQSYVLRKRGPAKIVMTTWISPEREQSKVELVIVNRGRQNSVSSNEKVSPVLSRSYFLLYTTLHQGVMVRHTKHSIDFSWWGRRLSHKI